MDFDSPVREPIAPFGGTRPADRDAKSAQPAPARRYAARPAPAPRVSIDNECRFPTSRELAELSNNTSPAVPVDDVGCV